MRFLFRLDLSLHVDARIFFLEFCFLELNRALRRVWLQKPKFQKKFRHLHGDLNLDEIKNALRLLSVNDETNLMNLIRL